MNRPTEDGRRRLADAVRKLSASLDEDDETRGLSAAEQDQLMEAASSSPALEEAILGEDPRLFGEPMKEASPERLEAIVDLAYREAGEPRAEALFEDRTIDGAEVVSLEARRRRTWLAVSAGFATAAAAAAAVWIVLPGDHAVYRMAELDRREWAPSESVEVRLVPDRRTTEPVEIRTWIKTDTGLTPVEVPWETNERGEKRLVVAAHVLTKGRYGDVELWLRPGRPGEEVSEEAVLASMRAKPESLLRAPLKIRLPEYALVKAEPTHSAVMAGPARTSSASRIPFPSHPDSGLDLEILPEVANHSPSLRSAVFVEFANGWVQAEGVEPDARGGALRVRLSRAALQRPDGTRARRIALGVGLSPLPAAASLGDMLVSGEPDGWRWVVTVLTSDADR